LMLGLMWRMDDWLVDQLTPGGAFSFNTNTGTRSMSGFTGFYFSFVTLSTVGYGDITPVSRIARMLAAMEAMTGLLYVAVLIARLVPLSSTPKYDDSHGNPLATVPEKRPAPLQPSSEADRVATQTIDSGLAEEQKQPLVALGAFVAAAQDALRQLDRNPANAEARRDYNFAVARIFTVVRDAKLDPWTQPMRVGANGEFTLTWKRDPRPEWNLALYDLIPADELNFKGTYVKDHVRKDGIGAPLVAKRELTAQQASAFFTPPYIYYSVTATAQFEGSRCVISINDPLAAESVRVDGHSYLLAPDF